MIIKIYKISTMELWIMKNKSALIEFVFQETGLLLPNKYNIKKIIKYLPVEDYYYIGGE